MTLQRKLGSLDSREIKSALLELLNVETDKDVLECDDAFYAAADKHSYLARFESSTKGERPLKSPELLERWMHYCWLRAQVSFLANQKSSLNKIGQIQEETALASANKKAMPALTHSVARAIQEDAENQVPIENSISLLRKVTLQIVGTEHPTDPLSQPALEALNRLANAISDEESSHKSLRKIFAELRQVDPIPPFHRDVVEEVNRNIGITLDKLYDSLPDFINTIFAAYKTYYGAELYAQHENEICIALTGGVQPDGTITRPIVSDASWPGFDADGNINMTAEVMRSAIRLHRIRIAEKHSETLTNNAISISKEIERKLRREITDTNIRILTDMILTTDDKNILTEISTATLKVSQGMMDKMFTNVLSLFNNLDLYLPTLGIAFYEKNPSLFTLLAKQIENTNRLISLTKFSGLNKQLIPTASGSKLKEQQGALQLLNDIFIKHKDNIRKETDAIEIKDHNQIDTSTEYVIQHYDEIIRDNADLLTLYPELQIAMRNFSIQLHCYGMTYGEGHIRQDSSVFTHVWDVLLEDLKNDITFTNQKVLETLGSRNYKDKSRSDAERLEIQLLIQNKESGVLEFIYRNQHARKYTLLLQKSSDYKWVCSELERLEMALRHRDMFKNIIISNCESAANIFEVVSLLKIFPTYHQDLVVTPLLEKREDLKNYEIILTDYIKTKLLEHLAVIYKKQKVAGEHHLKSLLPVDTSIADFIYSHDRVSFRNYLAVHPELRVYLESVSIEVMYGYSDTERVSGLAALISVEQVQEDVVKLTADFGIRASDYHGRGGDLNRGGLNRMDEKGTLQGNARSNLLSTPRATLRLRETQFYRAYRIKSNPQMIMEFENKPQMIRDWIKECEIEGARFYEYLHDTEKGLGGMLAFLLGQGAHWLVSILNSSSRASKRGVEDSNGDRTAAVQEGGIHPENCIDLSKLRAITATQIKEVLRDYIGVLVGPGAGLRKIGLAKAVSIFESSEVIRDMVYKMMMGLALKDLSFLEHALFATSPQLIAGSREERQSWAQDVHFYAHKFQGITNLLHIQKLDRNAILFPLSRLFAYIAEEIEATQEFISQMMYQLYANEFRFHDKNTSLCGIDLLTPFPVWKSEIEDTIREMEPVSHLLARQCHLVAKGRHLDQVYLNLNNEKISGSRLSRVARVIGDIGAAVTAFRIIPPGFYEKVNLDYGPNWQSQRLIAHLESAGATTNSNVKHGLFSNSGRQHVVQEEQNLSLTSRLG